MNLELEHHLVCELLRIGVSCHHAERSSVEAVTESRQSYACSVRSCTRHRVTRYTQQESAVVTQDKRKKTTRNAAPKKSTRELSERKSIPLPHTLNHHAALISSGFAENRLTLNTMHPKGTIELPSGIA